MPHFPPDVHAYAHPEKTRHLQMEVPQAPQSQLSTSPLTSSAEPEMWNHPSPPPFTALPASSNDQVLPNLPQEQLFQLLSPQQKSSFRTPYPNRPLRFQSQPSPNPFSNYRIPKEMQISFSSQLKTLASRFKIWVLAPMAVISNWPWTSHFSQILIF